MIIDDLNRYRIVLASRSPRREQLLRETGLKFEVKVKEFNENYPEHLKGKEIAMHVALEKAKLFARDIAENEIVITADTIVWCNNRLLGKPADADDAKNMIREISGNTHEVITGVCLFSSSKSRTFAVSTKVTFDQLSEEEIAYYVDNFKPFDKAGAYGIQEWIGITACTNIEGSYFNVVGLPVQRVYKELQGFIKQHRKSDNKRI